MKFNAVIFARGGSKGLPKKNILPFAGKPLIAWTIELALKNSLLKEIYISTDCQEIARISENYGAIVPYLRPAELATDHVAEFLAWKHFVEFLDNKNIKGDAVVSLPATSPLRKQQDIENALTYYSNNYKKIDVVLGVTISDKSPWFNMVSIDGQNRIRLLNESKNITVRRQDAPKTYDITTAVYISKRSFVKKYNSIFEGVVHGIHIPKDRSIDIDTKLDFEIAEFIFKKQNIKK